MRGQGRIFLRLKLPQCDMIVRHVCSSLYTGAHACDEHRKELRAKHLLTPEVISHITASMGSKEPDLDRAYLEWMRV